MKTPNNILSKISNNDTKNTKLNLNKNTSKTKTIKKNSNCENKDTSISKNTAIKKEISIKAKLDVNKNNDIRNNDDNNEYSNKDYVKYTNHISNNMTEHHIDFKSQIVEKLSDLDLEEPQEARMKVLPINNTINNYSKMSNISNISNMSNIKNYNFSRSELNSISANNTISESKSNRINMINSINNIKDDNRRNKIIPHQQLPSRTKIQEIANKVNKEEELNPKRHELIVEVESNQNKDTYNNNNNISNSAYYKDNLASQTPNHPSTFNDFEKYYNTKLSKTNIDKNHPDSLYFQKNIPYIKSILTKGLTSSINYCNGINSEGKVAFHKEEKWISYLHYDSIIIESVEEDCNSNQIIFTYDELKRLIRKNENSDNSDFFEKKSLFLSDVIISDNNKVLVVYSKNDPCLFCFDVSEIKSFSSCSKVIEFLDNLIPGTKQYEEILEMVVEMSSNNNKDNNDNNNLQLLAIKLSQALNKTTAFMNSTANNNNNNINNHNHLKSLLQSSFDLTATSLFLNQKNKIKPISKTLIKQKYLHSIAFPSSNNFIIFLSSNSSQETYISLLDFTYSEILTTTVLPGFVLDLKINPYLNTNEFVSYSDTFFTFWRVSEDLVLQYQHGDIDFYKEKVEDFVIRSVDFTPPLSLTCCILVCLFLDSCELICVDSKTNSVVLVFSCSGFGGILNNTNLNDNNNELNHNTSISGIISNFNNKNNINNQNNKNTYNDEYNASQFNNNNNGYIYNVNNNNYQNDLFFKNLNKRISKISSRNNSNSNNKVLCGLNYFILVVNEKILFYELPTLKDIKHDNLNFLVNKEQQFTFDSNIIHVDFDIVFSQGIVKTSLGRIYYFDLKENVCFKMVSNMVVYSKNRALDFNSMKTNSRNNSNIINNDNDLIKYNNKKYLNEIVCVRVVNKNIKQTSLRKIDFKSGKLEDLTELPYNNSNNGNNCNSSNNNIMNMLQTQNTEYYLITAEKYNGIKVWSFPNNRLIQEFEIINEELTAMEISPNDLIIAASFNSGNMRFFKIDNNNTDKNNQNNAFLGKFKSVSYEYITMFKFLPDGKFIFAVDNASNLFLLKLENFSPLMIQLHLISNIQGEISSFNCCCLESYNKFGVLVANQNYQIFNRKYTNILKNLSYDSSIPQFYLYDKTELYDEFRTVKEKYNKNIKNNNTSNNGFTSNDNTLNAPNTPSTSKELFFSDFCPRNKNIIYFSSFAHQLIIAKDYFNHVIVKAIPLNYNPMYFNISPNSEYFVVFDVNGDFYFYNMLFFNENSNRDDIVDVLDDFDVIFNQKNLINGYYNTNFKISSEENDVYFKRNSGMAIKKLSFCFSNNGKHFVICSNSSFYTNSLFFK